MADQEVIIIGAGIGGIATSVYLAQKGYSVKIFEKNSFAGGRFGSMTIDGHDLLFTSDLAVMREQLEAYEPGSFHKLIKYMDVGLKAYRIGMKHIIDRNYTHFLQFFNLKNLWVLHQVKALKNHYRYTSKFFKHPNILIAASFWEENRYHAAKVCYRFMREIDDLVDGRKSIDSAISCMEKQVLSDKVRSWIKCLDKFASNDPETQELIRFYKDKAEMYRQQTLDQIENLKGLVSGRYLKSLEIIFKLYLSVYERINEENGLFTSEELNPSPEVLVRIVRENIK